MRALVPPQMPAGGWTQCPGGGGRSGLPDPEWMDGRTRQGILAALRDLWAIYIFFLFCVCMCLNVVHAYIHTCV